MPLHEIRENEIRIGPAPAGDGFRLEAADFLPQPRERLFEFFSDAFQLETLTPPWLRFSVLTPAPIRIEAGTLIDYGLRLHGLPLRWQSRIEVWEPPLRFVDVQTRGPYRRWRHEHLFEAIGDGTLCRDLVDYAVFGGRLLNALLVRRDLLKIFAFRQQRLRELFPAPGAPHP
jgi:ligand-binding SRPBCC domain-containing protein